MGVFWALLRRELGTFFASLSGYVTLAGVSLLLGVSFSFVLQAVSLDDKPLDTPLTELFYNTFYFWLILLLTTPVITMRAFAHERSAGTYETLMTAPVGDWEVVLAKFAGAWLFYLVMWLPLFGCLYVARHFAGDARLFSPQLALATFTGTALIGAVYIAAGCFASALTRSQVIAAMVAFALGVSLFVLSFFSFILPARFSWQDAVFKHIAMFDHMQDFVRGVIDTRAVVFYLSLTALFLYLTTRAVESRRWK